MTRPKRPTKIRLAAVAFAAAMALMVAVSGLVSVSAAPFNDVPAGHWTYGALEQLSSVELIDGYPPGFFSGTRRLTRYEMALSLAGALQRLATAGDVEPAALETVTVEELVALYNASGVRRPLSASEADLIRAAVTEFSPELEMLGHKTPAVVRATKTPGRQFVLDPSLATVVRATWHPSGSTSSAWTGGNPQGPSLRPSSVGSSLRVSGDDGPPWHRAAIARIGGAVFYVDESADGAPEAAPMRASSHVLDGTIHLAGVPLSGDRDSSEDRGLFPWQVTETRAGMHQLPLASNVSLSGQRTQRMSALSDEVTTQVTAQVMLGDVSIDGKLRSVKPGPDFDSRFEMAEEEREDQFGVGVTVRLGDIFLTTGQDVVRRTRLDDAQVVRSLTLGYSFMDTAASVTAGWQSVSEARERTSVDLNVPVPVGALHLGLAYDRKDEGMAISMTTLAMAGLRLWDNAEARASVSVEDKGEERTRATSLGLRYTLNPEAAVLLGYKFIDFAEPDVRENVTTAEFSIRF